MTNIGGIGLSFGEPISDGMRWCMKCRWFRHGRCYSPSENSMFMQGDICPAEDDCK